MTPAPIQSIHSYHAHIYFADAAERERAAQLRAQIGARFAVQLGRWHEQPIGPHDLPMYQVAFAVEEFARFIPFLMLNRAGLTILIHPNTRDARRDHLTHAFWMGKILPIVRPDQLPTDIDDTDMDIVVPNTAPSLSA